MNIAIIGAHGIVGAALVEHMLTLGHNTTSIDINTKETIANSVPWADVVFIVTLPLSETPHIINGVARHMKSDTLIIHGSSVESPQSLHIIDHDILIEKKITLCHCHFHFRPEIPLSRTLLGQSVSVSFIHDSDTLWRRWVENQFLIFNPQWHELNSGEHDDMTVVSQLTHMITCYVVGELWTNTDPRLVEKGMSIGGPPFRLLLRSFLRTSAGSQVASNILMNHPKTMDLIGAIETSLARLRVTLKDGDCENLAQKIASLRSIVSSDLLNEWDVATAQLLRLDADMRACNIEFRFGADKNTTGLLAQALNEFDSRGIEKTTTIAQVNPDGSCTFRIGVKCMDKKVQAAVAAINSW